MDKAPLCLAQVSDDVTDFVRATAAALVPELRVWLFGSRATGKARPASDYDLYVEVPAGFSESVWTNFVWTLNEDSPSLCRFDVVRSDEASAQIQQCVLQEGIVLTEGKLK